MPSIDEIVGLLLSPPTATPYRVTLDPTALWGYRHITLWSGGGQLGVRDAELQQLFDLIVDHFGLDPERPLSEFVGSWDEEWGADPRV